MRNLKDGISEVGKSRLQSSPNIPLDKSLMPPLNNSAIFNYVYIFLMKNKFEVIFLFILKPKLKSWSVSKNSNEFWSQILNFWDNLTCNKSLQTIPVVSYLQNIKANVKTLESEFLNPWHASMKQAYFRIEEEMIFCSYADNANMKQIIK